MGKRIRNQSGESVSLMASTVVISMGAGATFFLLMMVSPDSMPAGSTVIGFLTGFLLLMIVWQRLSRSRSASMSFWLEAGKNHREDGVAGSYTPRRVRERTPAAGTINRPIDVEEVREIQALSANTWVPTRQKRHRK